MQTYSHRKNRHRAYRRYGALRAIAVLFALSLTIRIAAEYGGDLASAGLLNKLAQDDAIVLGILNSELYGIMDSGNPAEIALRIEIHEPSRSSETEYITNGVQEPNGSSSHETLSKDNEPGLFYSQPEESKTSIADSPNPDVSPSLNAQTESAATHNIELRNGTDYEIDTEALLNEPLEFKLTDGDPSVLIIHTHSSEAYTMDGDDVYEESDPFRTEDKTKSIIRVGDELAERLQEHGIGVIHDRNSYDYPSYTGSYNRSYNATISILNKYPSIKLVIDLHRDAITAADGSQYKTLAQIGNETCSQILLVVGSDFSGLAHPNWRENLKFALRLQQKMDTLTPGLARPILLTQYRYNQQATLGSLIVEIGCAGNTLSESLAAARHFADAYSAILKEL